MLNEDALRYIGRRYRSESAKAIAKNLGISKKKVAAAIRDLETGPQSSPEKGRPAAPPLKWILFDLAVLFLIALTVRLAYHFQINAFPYLNIPTVDAQGYIKWAADLASGNWLGTEAFFQAPGYPYFLGALFSIFGVSIQAAQVAQQVLGALTCLVLYMTAYHLFGRATAIVTGLFAAGYGILVCYAGFLIKPTLEIFLLAVFLWLIARQSEKVSWWASFLAGLLLMIATLIIANLILLAPFALLWLVWTGPARERRNRLIAVVFFGLGAAAALVPVTLRNYQVSGDVVMVSSQGGMNLYIGNNPEADGTYKPLYNKQANLTTEARYNRQLAEQAVGRSLKPSEVSQYWAGKAIDFVLQNPGRFFWLELRKLHLFWNAYEVPDTESYYFYQRFSSVLKWLPVRFGWIAVLGLVGLVLTWRDPRARLLHWLVLGVLVITLPFFVLARYRLPVVLPLIILAAHASVRAAQMIRRQDMRGMLVFGCVAAVFAAGVFSPFPMPLYKKAEISTALYNLGALMHEKGRTDEALNFYRNAAAAFDKNPLPRARLMEFAFQKGDMDEAKSLAEEILRIHTEQPDAWAVLGDILVKEGKMDQARNAYEKSLAIDAGHERAGRGITTLT
ncbi:MAG: glycosyltransferase family 39 protein [Candidatus Omnitrophota bacterium]|nr:glycosyltransferase family 39 protein [Candidatus Omnitrophota bacterium]